MKFTTRQYSILRLLNDSSSVISSDIICQKLSISARTLRYEVSDINHKAKANVIKSNAKGYFVDVDTDLQKLFENIAFDDFTNEGGINWLLIKILDKDKISIYDLEELFHKSASALTRTIASSTREIERFHINIKQKGENIYVEGKESDKRKYLMHTFFNNGSSDFSIDLNINRYFEVLTPEEVHELINEIIERKNIKIADIFLKNIVLIFSITLQRVFHGYEIEKKYSTKEVDSREKNFVDDVCNSIENETKIKLDVNEKEYLYRTLFPLIRTGSIEENEIIKESNEFKSKLMQSVNDTLNHFSIDSKYDDLLPNFTMHVYYLIVRARTNSFFQQDVTGYIKYSNPYVHEVAVYLASKLEKQFDIKICKEEIGLLAIYLSSLISKNNDEYLRVVVTSPNYHMMRDDICRKLNLYFGTQIKIIECVTSYNDIKSTDYDFVISVYERQKTLKNVISISPLLGQKDIEKIELRIAAIYKKRSINSLENEFKKLLKFEYFFYDNRQIDGKDILKELCDKLYEDEIVPKEYYEDVLKREELSSTAFYNQIAIPHALTIKSRKNRLIYYYNKTPIDWFGNKINLILLFANKGYDEDFYKLYNLIFDVIMDEDLLIQIQKCKTYDELMEFLVSII